MLLGEDSVPLRSTPAPPTVSCVLAARELVSDGPRPPALARGWASLPKEHDRPAAVNRVD